MPAISALRYGSGELNRTIRSTHSGWRRARSWMTGPPRSPPSRTTWSRPSSSWTRAYRSWLWLGTSWKPAGPTSLSPKPRRSGTMTSKPAAASGSITRQKIRLLSGQPWTHSSGTPPGLTRTYAWRKPRGAAYRVAKRSGSVSASMAGTVDVTADSTGVRRVAGRRLPRPPRRRARAAVGRRTRPPRRRPPRPGAVRDDLDGARRALGPRPGGRGAAHRRGAPRRLLLHPQRRVRDVADVARLLGQPPRRRRARPGRRRRGEHDEPPRPAG